MMKTTKLNRLIITEIEALDRLYEAFEEVGAIKWITHSKYQKITN